MSDNQCTFDTNKIRDFLDFSSNGIDPEYDEEKLKSKFLCDTDCPVKNSECIIKQILKEDFPHHDNKKYL